MFSFTGWQSPTQAPGCGRVIVLPRELGVRRGALSIMPVNETARLRVSGSLVRTSIARPKGVANGNKMDEKADVSAHTLATGSQVELRARCSGTDALSTPAGKIGVRTLGTWDSAQYTEIGYDLGEQTLYVDHSRCCAASNAIVQRAALDTE